jgi:hypothetical protein
MVKLDIDVLGETLEIRTVHEAYINFEQTFNELVKLGYYPRGCNVDRKTHRDNCNLTFTLKSGALINISSEGPPHKIQITWNLLENSEKQFSELTSVLIPIVGEKLIIVPVSGQVHNMDKFPDSLFEDKMLLQLLTALKKP